jgi:hypothetical protein
MAHNVCGHYAVPPSTLSITDGGMERVQFIERTEHEHCFTK